MNLGYFVDGVVVIMGVVSGIGLVLVQFVMREGMIVVVMDIDEVVLQEVK